MAKLQSVKIIAPGEVTPADVAKIQKTITLLAGLNRDFTDRIDVEIHVEPASTLSPEDKAAVDGLAAKSIDLLKKAQSISTAVPSVASPK